MGIRPSVPPILKTYFDFFLAYVLEEITRSTELLGTRARIGRGVGAGTDDDRQPAVIWVKSLENVIYGSKVEQKVIKIPAEQIHLTLGEIGTDAHSVLKGSDRIPTEVVENLQLLTTFIRYLHDEGEGINGPLGEVGVIVLDEG